MSPEQIEHPSHYVAGEIEAWDVIWDHGFGYHLGNVVKYLLRAGNKGPAIDDLRKARQYLAKAMDLLRSDSGALDDLRPSHPAPHGSVDLQHVVRAFRLPGIRAMALTALCAYHTGNPDSVLVDIAMSAIEFEIDELARQAETQ